MSLASGGVTFVRVYVSNRVPDILHADLAPVTGVTVKLTVPYDLQRYKGWVVTARVHGKDGRILLRTNEI